jgi:CheY-like chemotaxis protein
LATILVVDDDPVLQMAAARVLEQAGHAFVVDDDGTKGLARSQVEAFDLPLIDVFMPSTDGFETMRRILQQRLPIITKWRRPSTPDSMREPDYPTMATNLGAVHALPKPFTAVFLAMAADRLTSSRPDRDAVPNS